MEDHPSPPDTLNTVGLLKRREIEARLLAPLIDALSTEFDRERVLELVGKVIQEMARQQGAQLARSLETNDLEHFANIQETLKKDDAIQTEVLVLTNEQYSYNVFRCRFAEMYHQLGIPELGKMISCNRDFALIEGFNPDIQLTRTQTLMEGAAMCDFRFMLAPSIKPRE
jgi:predicted ArsR family transcriptional regulator